MSPKWKLCSEFELGSLVFIVSHEIVGGICNLLSSLWPQQKFEATDGPVLQERAAGFMISLWTF